MAKKNETLPRLLSDRVLIEPEDAPDKTPGGIVLPDVAKDRAMRGKVVAVGSGQWDAEHERYGPMIVMVGDRVLLSPHFSDWRVNLGGQTYWLVREDDVAGIL